MIIRREEITADNLERQTRSFGIEENGREREKENI